MTTTHDLTVQLERSVERKHQALDVAARCEARGWYTLAKMARREAAGHKANITRLVRLLTEATPS